MLNSLTSMTSIVSFALMAAAVGPMLILVNSTPDRIPADIIAEEQNSAMKAKLEGMTVDELEKTV